MKRRKITRASAKAGRAKARAREASAVKITDPRPSPFLIQPVTLVRPSDAKFFEVGHRWVWPPPEKQPARETAAIVVEDVDHARGVITFGSKR